MCIFNAQIMVQALIWKIYTAVSLNYYTSAHSLFPCEEEWQFDLVKWQSIPVVDDDDEEIDGEIEGSRRGEHIRILWIMRQLSSWCKSEFI